MPFLYLISELKVPLSADAHMVKMLAAAWVGLAEWELSEVRRVKQSIDARRRSHPIYVLQVEFETERALRQPLPAGVRALDVSTLEVARPVDFPLKPTESSPASSPGSRGKAPVIVVGAGPAGLFAALALGEAGIPTLLLERGKEVEPRMRDIGQLRSHGTLDPESNVCFGEGGAGAYTDGKLYTRIKDPLVRWVLKRFVDFGAPADILIKSHPHLGTDKLVRIVKTLRMYLIERQVAVRFGAKMKGLIIRGDRICGVSLEDGEELEGRAVILAIGHSARDTLAELMASGIRIEPKPFAVGVRAEHPQSLIDQRQYRSGALADELGAASYQMSYQFPDTTLGPCGIYTFCMCPGGFIVPSPTEPELMAVNGMSNANRSAPFANSGVVVQVNPELLPGWGYPPSPLIGIEFQRELERKTFAATMRPYAAPAMRISDFVSRKPSGTLAPTHFRPAAEAHDLWEILPAWIAEPLRLGLLDFDHKIKGYVSDEANILAVESRTSSPVRIPRGETMQATGFAGLFPVGEGAGYAGGIVSAAVDGLRAARIIIGNQA